MIDCPIPNSNYERILLGHGSGGRLTEQLIAKVFMRGFSRPPPQLEDHATLDLRASNGRVAFTTDAFVVRPLFFPGGDIGKLAVNGTVNDLAVGGATPRFLSAAFVLEEGLPIADLERIVISMREACDEAGVELVTGDTKVVDKGKGDGVFITTSGVGVVPHGRTLSIGAARAGDCILVSGPIGDHGIAILSVREGLELETTLESDTAPLADLCRALLEVCPAIRVMRDPTRGGLAGVLCDLARASKVGVRIDGPAIPVRASVRAACELLGLDPLHVACEGRLVAVVPRDDAERVLTAMREHPKGTGGAIIGEVVETDPGVVLLTSAFGTTRAIATLAGEQLPRIC